MLEYTFLGGYAKTPVFGFQPQHPAVLKGLCGGLRGYCGGGTTGGRRREKPPILGHRAINGNR
jgi:hypothetical protein